MVLDTDGKQTPDSVDREPICAARSAGRSTSNGSA